MKRGSEKAGPPVSAKEVQRRAEFCKAVRAYEWDAALTLAATDKEKTDVAESKNRVDWLEYFLAQGDNAQAMLYAITNEERQRAEPGGAQSTPIDDAFRSGRHRGKARELALVRYDSTTYLLTQIH